MAGPVRNVRDAGISSVQAVMGTDFAETVKAWLTRTESPAETAEEAAKQHVYTAHRLKTTGCRNATPAVVMGFVNVRTANAWLRGHWAENVSTVLEQATGLLVIPFLHG